MPPLPKEPSQRARRNVDSTAATIEAQPAKMPDLGKNRPDGPAWAAQTRTAWRTWWGSPVAERWIDAYVPTLRQLAVLFDDFYKVTTAIERRAIMAELRISGREFGLSVMSARALGWTVRRPKEEAKRERSAIALPPGADPRKVLTLDSRRKAAG